MRFEFLGPMVVRSTAGTQVRSGGPKQRTVLAVLCLSPGEPVSVDRIVDAVWGEPAPDRGRQVLHTYVSNLRHDPGVPIDFDSGAYTLRVDRSAVDWCAFDDRVEAATKLSLPEAAEAYREALEWWRGEPFTGLEGHGVFDDVAARLEQLRMRAEVGVIEAAIQSGNAMSVLPGIDSMITSHEFDEQLRGLHMRALYAAGRQHDALESYDMYRALLVEHGLEPSQELHDLEYRVLNHDPTLDGPSEPEHAGVPVSWTLPLRFSSFRGRTDELQTVDDWLEGGSSQRLLTLLGPGGIGKSSIAMEGLRAHTTDAVKVYVPIDQATESEVGTLVARALGLAPGPGVDPIRLAAKRLNVAPHVLLLDGCERDIAGTSSTVTGLLESSPCRIIATSRIPLGLGGEALLHIGPLDQPDGVAIFRDRSGIPPTTDSGTTETVIGICDRLDGIPLAIELAAARVGPLSLDRVANRLSDQVALLTRHGTHDHHGSLRTTLDWSFDLLSEEEEEALFAVATFAGRFTIDDAAALIGLDGSDDLIAALVEASFIQPPDPRGDYRLLEPIRQYATWQMLNAGSFEEAQQQHSRWVVEYVRQAAELMYTPSESEASRRVYEKQDDLLAAIQTAMNLDDPDTVLAIIAAVGRSLYAVGLHDLVAEPAMWAIEHPAAVHSKDYPMACHGALYVAWRYTTPEQEDAIVERALAAADRLGDLRARRELLAASGSPSPPFVPVSDIQQQQRLNHAIELAQQTGESLVEQNYLLTKTLMLQRLGRLTEAEAAMHRAEELDYDTILSNPWWFARRAGIAAVRGDWEGAIDLHIQGAQMAEAVAGYLLARGLWRDAGLCAIRIGRIEDLRRTRRAVERIDGIVGPFPSIPYDIEIAHVDGDHDTVLDLARQWIGYHPVPTDEQDLSPTETWLLHGNEGYVPGLFIILRPATQALLEKGRTDDACWIAAHLPRLMNQSPHQHWNSYREAELWEDILSRCEGHTVPEPLNSVQMYQRITEIIGSTPPDPHAPRPRLYEI